MLFRHSGILGDPKMTAFFRIKLLVLDFFFVELLRLGWRGYLDNQVVDPLFKALRKIAFGGPATLDMHTLCDI